MAPTNKIRYIIVNVDAKRPALPCQQDLVDHLAKNIPAGRLASPITPLRDLSLDDDFAIHPSRCRIR